MAIVLYLLKPEEEQPVLTIDEDAKRTNKPKMINFMK